MKYDKETKCIFMHHDILSEGIDVPNMTGILMLRDLEENRVKFTQNVGRCCRIIKEDGNLEISKMKKPFSYISVPGYLVNTEKYRDMIKAIYTSYEINYSDVTIFIADKNGNVIERNEKNKNIPNKDIDLEFTHEIEKFLDLFNLKKIEEELQDQLDELDEEEKVELVSSWIDETYDEDNLLIEGLKSRLEEFEYFTRDPEARVKCLKKWGYTCFVCGKNLEDDYGPSGKNKIEVHHLKQICEGYRVTDPENDLIPVCPDCHTIIHTKTPCWGPYEVSEMMGIIELTEEVYVK